jgi:hypothetical protein
MGLPLSMLDLRSDSHIDYMLLNLANITAKEHSDVFFCSVNLTLHSIKGVRITAFQHHDYTALGGCQHYRRV